MALKVENDRIVVIAYRIVDSEGRLLEERTPETPYEYVQGSSQIVAPVERALEGKTAGFRCEVAVSPRDGFGDYDPDLVAELRRSQFPAAKNVQIGMKFNTVGPGGKMMVIRVIEVDGEKVTVDGNHPLAGLELVFEVRLLDVREGESGGASGGDSGGPLGDQDFSRGSYGSGSGTLH